jgi:hypothetical protein
LGISCFQNCCVSPCITNKLPPCNFHLLIPISPFIVRCLIINVLSAPRLTVAMTRFSKLSACNPIYTSPQSYRLSMT